MYIRLIVLLTAFTLFFADSSSAQEPKSGAGKAADGEKVFMSKCAGCHGKDASGDTATGKRLKVPDLRTLGLEKETEVQVVERIGKVKAHATIKKSVGDMGLADAAAYLRSPKMMPPTKRN